MMGRIGYDRAAVSIANTEVLVQSLKLLIGGPAFAPFALGNQTVL
jgi:hypothetical protein